MRVFQLFNLYMQFTEVLVKLKKVNPTEHQNQVKLMFPMDFQKKITTTLSLVRQSHDNLAPGSRECIQYVKKYSVLYEISGRLG